MKEISTLFIFVTAAKMWQVIIKILYLGSKYKRQGLHFGERFTTRYLSTVIGDP